MLEQYREQQGSIFNAFDAMLLAAIEIHPVADLQDGLRVSEQYMHSATQAVERRLPGNVVRRDYGASVHEEVDRLEGLGFDEGGRVGIISAHTQAGPVTAKLCKMAIWLRASGDPG